LDDKRERGRERKREGEGEGDIHSQIKNEGRNSLLDEVP
jgi:hypothetical protein